MPPEPKRLPPAGPLSSPSPLRFPPRFRIVSEDGDVYESRVVEPPLVGGGQGREGWTPDAEPAPAWFPWIVCLLLVLLSVAAYLVLRVVMK